MISVDKKTCIGCGACASICPEVFEMKETADGLKSVVKKQSKASCVKEAADSCPVNAINI
ncbi:MAG: ferredoxin [Candidatus Pacearchaeota archaeon]